MADEEITQEERAQLEAQGFREAEPGRWMSDWQDMDGNHVALPNSPYLQSVMNVGREMSSLDAELGGDGAYVQSLDMERLEEASQPPITTVLAIRDDHLDAFRTLDNEAFQTAFDEFTENRPFLTLDDALRAVLRSFGVRAKAVPDHHGEDHHQPGWRMVMVDAMDLALSEVLD